MKFVVKVTLLLSNIKAELIHLVKKLFQFPYKIFEEGYIRSVFNQIVMAKQSAGILLYRKRTGTEVFLIHPGGPFFAKKDLGSWSVPKGEYSEEDPLTAAKREFREETGFDISGNFVPLLPIKQKGGKVVVAWAVEGDIDAEAVVSNTFEIIWPPHSGKIQTFPEVDKAGWFSMDLAREKINQAQISFLDQLEVLLA